MPSDLTPPRCYFLRLHLGLAERHAHDAALGGAVGRRQGGAPTVLAHQVGLPMLSLKSLGN